VTKPLHGEPTQQWLPAVGCCQCGHATCSLQACLARSQPKIWDIGCGTRIACTASKLWSNAHLSCMFRLMGIWRRRLGGSADGTESAAPRARVSKHHDGRSARRPVPALPNVGTLSFFADRCQLQFAQLTFELLVLVALRCTLP
jgi:hypothetical protein